MTEVRKCFEVQRNENEIWGAAKAVLSKKFIAVRTL